MARRSDHSRPELATKVLEAARAIVLEVGWRGLTMRGIAARIGYAPGSIYNAVGDIDLVLARLGAASLTAMGDALEAAVARAGDDPREAALALAETYVEEVSAQAPLWATLLEHGQATVPEWFAEPRARLVTIAEGVLATLFPELAARRRAVAVLWAGLHGLASLAVGGNMAFVSDGIPPKDLARSLVLRYLSGSDAA